MGKTLDGFKLKDLKIKKEEEEEAKEVEVIIKEEAHS